jgi:hypothetical protein
VGFNQCDMERMTCLAYDGAATNEERYDSRTH